jgi:hypothetical protein
MCKPFTIFAEVFMPLSQLFAEAPRPPTATWSRSTATADHPIRQDREKRVVDSFVKRV